MKNFLLAFTLLLAPMAAFSQITILQSDIPMVAGTYYWGRDTSSVITPGSQGANITWDFSAFVPANTDTSSGGDPYVFTANPLFPTANFATSTNTSMIALQSYGFIDNTGIYGLGNDANFNFQTYTSHSLTFINPMVIVYPFPFTYNDTRNLTYVQNQVSTFVPASPYDSVKHVYHRERTINCDGWGTLITPYGTYSTIRLQRIETNVDTTFNHTTSGWVTGPAYSNIDTTYEWVAKNIGSVATIHRSGPTWTYRFFKSGTTGIEALHPDVLSVYPNPVTEHLQVDLAGPISHLSIRNITGQEVFSREQLSNSIEIDLHDLAPGVYLLHAATAEARKVTQKIVKQ